MFTFSHLKKQNNTYHHLPTMNMLQLLLHIKPFPYSYYIYIVLFSLSGKSLFDKEDKHLCGWRKKRYGFFYISPTTNILIIVPV